MARGPMTLTNWHVGALVLVCWHIGALCWRGRLFTWSCTFRIPTTIDSYPAISYCSKIGLIFDAEPVLVKDEQKRKVSWVWLYPEMCRLCGQKWFSAGFQIMSVDAVILQACDQYHILVIVEFSSIHNVLWLVIRLVSYTLDIKTSSSE